jgi:hypothetical protein
MVEEGDTAPGAVEQPKEIAPPRSRAEAVAIFQSFRVDDAPAVFDVTVSLTRRLSALLPCFSASRFDALFTPLAPTADFFLANATHSVPPLMRDEG